MKSNQKEFLKILSAYQGIIHKVNQVYFKSKIDKRIISKKSSISFGVLSHRYKTKRNQLHGFMQ